MSAAWQSVTLSEVCEFKPAKKQAKQKLDDGDLVSFAPMGDLGELRMQFAASEERPLANVYSGYTYFADGDVLCAKITPCFENGKMGVAAGLTNGIGFGSSEFVVMRPSARILAEFLFYFMLRDEFRVSGAKVMTGAVGHKRVPKEYFEDHAIPLPLLEEQKRIVAVLDQAFAALDRARANAEANLADAEALFEATISAIFGKRENWPVEALNDRVRFIDYRGKTPPKRDHGIRLITAKNVRMGYIKEDPCEFMLESAYDDWMVRGFPEKGDVLFTTEAPLANVAELDTDEKVVIGQRLITMKTDRDQILPGFLKWSLLSPQMQAEIRAKGTGATVTGIKASLLKKIPLFVPADLEVQKAIAGKCERVFENKNEIVAKVGRSLCDLEDLRQSILQKAFAGELT